MSAGAGLHRVRVYRALNRPNLALGGERELTLITTLLTVVLIVAAQNKPAFVAGVVLYALAMAALTRMAKADPFMSKVYLRHIRYSRFYAARSSIWQK